MKKLLSLLLSLIMALTMFQSTMFSTSAKVVGPDLKTQLTIHTEKSAYAWGDSIVFNVDVKNVTNMTLTGVQVKSLAKDILLISAQEDTAAVGSLAPGETKTVQVTFRANSKEGITAILFPLIWLFGSYASSAYRNTSFQYEQRVQIGVFRYRFGFAIGYDGETPYEPDDEIIDLGSIENMVNEGLVEVTQNDDLSIRTIDGTFTSLTATNEEEAKAVIEQSAKIISMGNHEISGEMEVQTADTESADEVQFIMMQKKDGIPVEGGEIIILTDTNGKVIGMVNSFKDNVNTINTTPSTALDSDNEIRNAIDYDVKEDFGANTGSTTMTKELVIDAFTDSRSPKLAWKVTVSYGVQTVIYYLAANNDVLETGTIYRVMNDKISATSVTETAADSRNMQRTVNASKDGSTTSLWDMDRNIKIYKADGYYGTSYPGTLVTKGSTWNRNAISAMYNLEKTYDYYKDLGRRSYDGKGTAITASIGGEIGEDSNAFWSSTIKQYVFYEQGNNEAALDVVAHEYTHSVINTIVGGSSLRTTLTYYGETGALNEAYADIMGSLVENKSGAAKWTFGEDSSDGAIRSLANPAQYGYPTHYSAMSSSEWLDSLNRYEARDHEGVHIFGSIYALAAYKMMTDSRTSSISSKTWADIFYHSLFRLTTDAKFLDGRLAVISAAKACGFDSSKQEAIKDAFDAVGIVESDAIRIVLRWGSTPNDLDSHLTGPGVRSQSNRFHTYWIDRNYYCNGSYESSTEKLAADLDYDDTTSYGPEITTIRTMTPGTYYYYVHDYTNRDSNSSNEMALSGANVTIYKGNSSTPMLMTNGQRAAFQIKTNSNGTLWTVCKITIDNTGNVSISAVDTYSYHSSSSTVGA